MKLMPSPRSAVLVAVCSTLLAGPLLIAPTPLAAQDVRLSRVIDLLDDHEYENPPDKYSVADNFDRKCRKNADSAVTSPSTRSINLPGVCCLWTPYPRRLRA